VPRHTNSYFFLFWPVLFLSILYTLYLNAYWGVNLILFDIEFNILFITIISLLLNFCIFFTGFFSKNKYAIISSQRAVVLIFCGELLLTVFYLTVIFFFKSFSFSNSSSMQQEWVFFIQSIFIQNLIVILILIEVNKSPFDLIEAETELVTGFHTEYGAFFFALFYLGEYFHIFFTSVILVIILNGF
jgi:NADH-quinone oxidoreductase subunit H